MLTPEKMISVDGQHALQDMVELEMYLVARSQQIPWPMCPRSAKKRHGGRKPYSQFVQSSDAKELIGRGYIEATSSRTFVVSKSGHQFYEREMKLSCMPDSGQ